MRETTICGPLFVFLTSTTYALMRSPCAYVSVERQHGFRLAEVDVDVVVLDALDEARQDVTLAAHELLVDDAALCLADALDDDLLRRLSGDAAEIRRRHLDLDDVAYLVVRLDRAGLSQRNLRDLVLRVLDDRLDRVDMIVTRLSGKRDADILRRAKVALVSRDQGSLDGLEEDLFIDAFLLAELFERHQEFLTIVLRFRRFSCQNDILPNERGNAPFFAVSDACAVRSRYAGGPVRYPPAQSSPRRRARWHRRQSP